jgi:hypothetical protein
MSSASDRAARHRAVSAALATLTDRHLAELMNAAPVIATGIGGTSVALAVEGVPVFAKRIPLTDLERRPEHVLSTANLFGLPAFCQYGVGLGAPGFGVWREVAANLMTTDWVLTGQCDGFPLMYHWRMLPGPPVREPSVEDRAERERRVEFWHGSPAIRERLAAVAGASASVVLFLERFPGNLRDWLRAELSGGDPEAVRAAAAMVERHLRTDVSFSNAHGLLHFDAHFGNILTDGRRLYLADFGLATSPDFELSADERDFVARNRTHDGCYVVTQLVNWLVTVLLGLRDPGPRNEYVRRCARTGMAEGIPPGVAAIVTRYAPVAVVMNDFYWTLYGERRTDPYPAEEIDRVCAATGFRPILP